MQFNKQIICSNAFDQINELKEYKKNCFFDFFGGDDLSLIEDLLQSNKKNFKGHENIVNNSYDSDELSSFLKHKTIK